MHAKGFTLLEVMIVVAIVAILGAVALPSYRESVNKSRRAEARAQLTEAMQYMQRFYSQNDRYDQTNAATPVGTTLPAPLQVSPKGASAGSKAYDISFVDNSLTANAFTLQAVPKVGGPMANDRCGTFQITNTGRRTVSTSVAVDDCWR